ncbi:UNVERIFIED_CONTAM: hypothetical protein FKN15_052711 [Acipenser sinensis]
MGEITKAENYLEKLEDICKKFSNTASRYSVLLPAVYGEKGWSFLKVCDEKHYKIAKECFERALEEEPNEKGWNADYAIVLYRLETFGPSVCAADSVALKQLKHALELDPENPVLMVHLGMKLQRYEQNEEALELVNQALKLSPDNPQMCSQQSSRGNAGRGNTGSVDSRASPCGAGDSGASPCGAGNSSCFWGSGDGSRFWGAGDCTRFWGAGDSFPLLGAGDSSHFWVLESSPQARHQPWSSKPARRASKPPSEVALEAEGPVWLLARQLILGL